MVTRVENSFTPRRYHPGIPHREIHLEISTRLESALRERRSRWRDRDVGWSSSKDTHENRVYLSTYEVEPSPRSPSIEPRDWARARRGARWEEGERRGGREAGHVELCKSERVNRERFRWRARGRREEKGEEGNEGESEGARDR